MTVTVKREAERVGLSGEMEDIEYTGAELCILITDDHGRQWSFMEQRLRTDQVKIIGLSRDGRDDDDAPEGVPAKDCIDFTLQELIAHFIIPAVPDVAAVDPEGYNLHLEELREIEALCQQENRQ